MLQCEWVTMFKNICADNVTLDIKGKRWRRYIPVITTTSDFSNDVLQLARSVSSRSRDPWNFLTRKGVWAAIKLACCSTRATLGTRKTMTLPRALSCSTIHLMSKILMKVFPLPVSSAAMTLHSWARWKISSWYLRGRMVSLTDCMEESWVIVIAIGWCWRSINYSAWYLQDRRSWRERWQKSPNSWLQWNLDNRTTARHNHGEGKS